MGGQGEFQSTGLLAGGWEFALDYRYFYANQFFNGTAQATPPGQYFGNPLRINVHSVDLAVTYAISDRYSVRLTVPFIDGSQSRFYSDTARHKASTGGVGDINVVVSRWLRDPLAAGSGNVALGIGVKVPTGRYGIQRPFYRANQSPIPFAVDQSIQLGDGGWGIVVQGQAFRRLPAGLVGYFTGSYLISPRNQTDILRTPTSSVHYSVSDIYSARAGLSFGALPARGLSLALGARIDGIPYHDLIGASDGFRRPGYVVLVDPAITYEWGLNAVTFAAPIRAAERLATAAMVNGSGGAIGAGDLAKVVLFLSFSRRLPHPSRFVMKP